MGKYIITAGSIILLAIVTTGGLFLYPNADYWIDRADGKSCVGCHVKLHPIMIQEWKNSPHFTEGVGCEACHGTDHAQIQSTGGKVSAQVCGATCHAREYAQFTLSKHSKPKTGRKADLLSLYPNEVGSCSFTTGCHAVRQPYSDGSSGKCSSCHPSHSFSMAITRDPATCKVCHSQSNNTESEEYERSIHGVMYRTVGLEGGGANCVTCHMPDGNHNDSFNTTDILLEPGDGRLTFVHTMPREEFDQKRAAMIDICKQCHGVKLAKRALEEADAFRKKGAYMLEVAATIVRQLNTEGLLDPMPHNRKPNPLAGPVLYLGPNQLFDNEMSAAERIFYRMYMFTYSSAWRRAYHNLPALMRWHENEMLKNDLIMLRAEAARLRALHRAGGMTPSLPPTIAQTAPPAKPK